MSFKPASLILTVAIALLVPIHANAACELGSSTPSVALSYTGPDSVGRVTVSIAYNFLSTSSPNQRKLWFQVNGVNRKTLFYPATPQGVWTFPYDTTCWAQGTYSFTAWAEACGMWKDGYIGSSTQNVVVGSTLPIVNLSYSNIPGSAKATVSIDYNFPRTATSSQRRMWFQVDAVNKKTFFYPPQQQGTWTFEYDFACLSPGSHTLTAWLESCGKWETGFIERSEKTFVAQVPTVALVSSSPSPLGKVNVSIDYNFMNTASANQRKIWFQVDGVNKLTNFYPAQQQGTWSFEYDLSCLTPGTHTLTAWIESCGLWQTGFIANSEQNVQIDKPEATVSVKEAADGSWDAVVNYDFPQTSSSSQRHLRLEWLPDGAMIGELRPTAVSGEWVVDLPACVSGSREAVRVVATSCSATTVIDQTPAFLPECDMVCSIECPDCAGDPIRITSGNMRLDDAEPLPAGDLGALNRTYDSNGHAGVFGTGWTSLFDARATIRGGTSNRETVFLVTESGDRYFFVNGGGTGNTYKQKYPAGQRRPTTLVFDPARSVFIHRGGSSSFVRIFRASDGRLSAMRNVAHPEETSIVRDANGLPTAVVDGRGRWSWTISTTNGRIGTVAVTGDPQLTWTYVYDAQNRLQTVSNIAGTWRTYAYGSEGMTEARDGAGRLLEGHQYDASGYAITSDGPSGEITAIEYDLPGRVEGETVTRVTSAAGKVTNYYSRYIAGKMRTVEVNGNCNCGSEDAVFVYDAEGHIVREQNARGFITSRLFDDWRMIEETTGLRPLACDPSVDAGQCRLTPDDLETVMLTSTNAMLSQSLVYADPNWPDRPTSVFTTSVRNPNEDKTQEYVYDAATGEVLIDTFTGWTGVTPVQETRRRITTLYAGSEPAAFDPGGAFSAWASLPQPYGARKSVDGPRTELADITTFVHYPLDAAVPALLRGHLAASKDPLGHITRYESYNIFGSPTRVVDASGVASEMTYDTLGRPLTTTTKGVAGCDTTLDPLCGQDVTVQRTYAVGNGPLSMEELADGSVSIHTCDDRGRVVTVSRGPSATDLRERIEYEYDPATGGKSLERVLGYEGGSWVETRRQSQLYDTSGRRTEVVNADGTSTAYAYQAGGLITSVRDENHTTPNTFYDYDPAGRLIEVRQTLGSGTIETGHGYDLAGNLTSVTDPNGNVTSYVYDDFGQMLEQTSPVTGVTSYQYDVAGNMVTVTDANQATTTRTYDASSRVTSAVSSRAGLPAETVTWTYGDTDAAPFLRNRLTSMADPSGSTVYQYDRRGILAREQKTVGQASYTTSFTHDTNGNRTTITYPSGRISTYTHDYAGRPLSLSSQGTPIVTSASYLPFGPAKQLVFGNGTTQTFTRDNRYLPQRNTLTGASMIADYDYGRDDAGNITRIDDLTDPGWNRAFGYDGLNRLVTANGAANLWGTGSYTYDAMGNMLTATLGAWRTASFSLSGTTPKLIAATENGAQRLVSYDTAGNETTVGATSYAHTARNQVASASALTYSHDGRGVRTITANGGANRYSFYTPELNLLAETETTASNTPAISWEYIWFGGQPVAQIETTTGAVHYYFNDHLSTPILTTDSTGTVDWRVEREPFGKNYAVRVGADRYQPLSFPGQENDGSSELSYNIFRLYRSSWGRYTQSDPVGLALAGSREGVNHLFLYAEASPTMRVDRKGLFATKMCGLAAIDTIKKAMSQLASVDLSKCVGCDLGFTAEQLKKKLTNMTVNCLESEEQGAYGITSDVCALSAKPSYGSPYKLTETGSDVTVVPSGLNGDCGCLPQLLLHEAGHLTAGKGSGGGAPVHQKIIDMAKGCVPCK